MSSRMQLATGIAGFFLFSSTATAQQTDDSGFTLKVKARAVITDVVVTDKKGNPVIGLPESAFHLTDDGHTERLASFEGHSLDTEASSGPATLPANTYSSDTSDFPDVLNILVIDTLSLSFVDQMFLSYQLERFIAALPSRRPLAVYLRAGSHSVQLQGITSDHTLLLNAVHHALPHLPRFTVDSNQEVETLHQIASDLGQVPGRKNVIWLTGAIAPPFTLSALESGQLESGLRIAYDELQQARVAIYPIDARGLVVNDPIFMGYSRKLMDDIAEATGGTALYNSNGIALQVNAIVARANDFYTLSYTPHSLNFDGKWHKVRVTVDGPYLLSYRHGYYADDTQRLLPGGTRTRLGVLGNTYQENTEERMRPIVFTAHVAPAPPIAGQPAPPRGKTPYAIDFAVSADGFRRHLAGGKSELRLRIGTLAMDRYGVLLTSRATEHDYDVNEENLRQHPEVKIPATQIIDLGPGDTYLYLVVWDPLSERAGTLSVPVQVPKVH